MHVATRRGVRRVHVGVRINPQETDGLTAAPVVLGDAGNRADGDRMITADDDRQLAIDERVAHAHSDRVASRGDLMQVPGARFA